MAAINAVVCFIKVSG